MKKLLIIAFIGIGLLSCTPVKTNDIKSNKDSTCNTLNSQIRKQDSIKVVGNITQNYNISPNLFDDMVEREKAKFIYDNRDKLNRSLSSHYDQYSTINNIDSIFEVLTSCDFSLKTNQNLISFYIHVLFEILKNNKADGYVEESIIDTCYMLFNNYPGSFYQHLKFTNEDIKELLINNIALGLYYNDNNEDSLSLIFEKQKEKLPNYKKQISTIERSVKEKFKNID